LRRLGRDFGCCCGGAIEGVVFDGACLLEREDDAVGDGDGDGDGAAVVFVFV
jgi:hypothetical protein